MKKKKGLLVRRASCLQVGVSHSTVTAEREKREVMRMRTLMLHVFEKLWIRITLALILIVLSAVWPQSVKYQPCKPTIKKEIRQLFVATCDTRTGWKEFNALKVWNVTGIPLRNEGVIMRNVCTGRNWGAHGYLTKPLIYLEFLKSLPKTSPWGGKV